MPKLSQLVYYIFVCNNITYYNIRYLYKYFSFNVLNVYVVIGERKTIVGTGCYKIMNWRNIMDSKKR